MSQSLFLALIDVYYSDGSYDEFDSISTVRLSCIAIIFTIILSSVALFGGIFNGFRGYEVVMPLVGSCSAAISAACHKMSDDRILG